MSTRATTAVAALTILASLGQIAVAQDLPCPGDTNGDRRVTVAEVVLAVNHLLKGCPGTTPTPVRTPRPTATPGSVELQVLQVIGNELVPAPGQFGCSANNAGDAPGQARLTCELPVAFALVTIDRYDDAASADQAFDDLRGISQLIRFHGYDAFEEAGVALALGNTPTLSISWRADQWVFRSTQITVFANITSYLEIAESVFTEAVVRGLFPDLD